MHIQLQLHIRSIDGATLSSSWAERLSSGWFSFPSHSLGHWIWRVRPRGSFSLGRVRRKGRMLLSSHGRSVRMRKVCGEGFWERNIFFSGFQRNKCVRPSISAVWIVVMWAFRERTPKLRWSTRWETRMVTTCSRFLSRVKLLRR